MYDKSGLSTPSPVIPIPNRVLFRRSQMPVPLKDSKKSSSVSDVLDDVLAKVNEGS